MSSRPVISIIAAVSQNNIIGSNGKMPWHIPEDLKHFKKLTMGCPVIMGRKTYDSIGKPLPGRHNIVITRQRDLNLPECRVCHSLEDGISHAQSLSPMPEEIFLIGGGHIYESGMSLADYLYITEIDTLAEGDVNFPAINSAVWKEISRESGKESLSNISFSFTKHKRANQVKK